MSELATAVQTSDLATLEGKYLSFALGEEVYGVAILKVQEIIGLMNVTSVPRTPEYVRGVINLRGKVIPVVDLRIKFGMEKAEDTERTCIIVVQIATPGDDEITMGVIVDSVSEVIEISSENIEPTPTLGNSTDTRFILGMGKVEEKVVMLLDVDQALSSQEIKAMEALT